jgi:hypothetical protein
MSTGGEELAELRERVADLERRLDAQGRAWTAWREASGRQAGTGLLGEHDAAMTPRRCLRLVTR